MRNKIFQEVLDETPKEVEIFVEWYAELAVRINRILREKGMSQKMLAEKMGKTPAEISRWLNGEHNFTLKSLAKLQAELGEPLLSIAQGKSKEQQSEAEPPSGVQPPAMEALAILLPLLQRQKAFLSAPQDWKRLSIHPNIHHGG
jgi:transcriptional regulator with XRE-family HTH domain